MCAVALLLTALRAWHERDTEVPLTPSGTMTAESYLYSLRAFEVHGVAALRLAPTNHSLNATREGYRAYDRHPPASWLLAHALAQALKPEHALRLLTLLAWCFGAGGLVALCRRLGQSEAGPWAAAALLVIPAGWWLAPTFDSAHLTVALVPWLLWAWLARVRGLGIRIWWVVALLAASLNWYVYGLVPVLMVAAVASSDGSRERLRGAACVALPFTLGLLMHLAWVIWVRGGTQELGEVLGAYLMSFTSVDQQMLDQSGGQGARFVAVAHLHLWRGLGAIGLLSLLLGAVLAWRGPGDRRVARVARVAMLMAAGALVTTLAFSSRFAGHPFLVTHWLAAAAMAFGSCVAAGLARWPKRTVAAAGLGLALSALSGAQELRDLPRSSARELAVGLDEAWPKGVLLLPFDDYQMGLRATAQADVLFVAGDPLLFRLGVEQLASSAEHLDEVWLVARESSFVALGGMPWVPKEALGLAELRRATIAGEVWLGVPLRLQVALRSR